MLDKMLLFIASLLIQADFVVERGKSSIHPTFTYEKWKNGRIVYHFIYASNFSFPTRSGNLYYSSGTCTPPSDIPQPVELVDAYGHFSAGNGLCFIEANTIQGKTAKFFYACGSQEPESAPLQKTAHLYLVGRWK